MKQIKTILACGLVFASVGVTTMVVAAGAAHDGKAIVRSMHGDVEYQVDGTGDFKKLRTNMELTPKTVLKSAAGAEAYLQVNGYTSTVKLTESTTMTLAKMEQIGGMMSMDSSTDLKLDEGQILGSVRKISATSEYNVAVPNGVAGIRGTDFSVTVTIANGVFSVTFTSVTGQLLCQVNVPAGTTTNPTSQNLTTGQSWTFSGTSTGGVTTVTTVSLPSSTPPSVQAALVTAVNNTATIVALNGGTGGGTSGGATTTTTTTSTTGSSDTGGTTTVTATTGNSD